MKRVIPLPKKIIRFPVAIGSLPFLYARGKFVYSVPQFLYNVLATTVIGYNALFVLIYPPYYAVESRFFTSIVFIHMSTMLTTVLVSLIAVIRQKNSLQVFFRRLEAIDKRLASFSDVYIDHRLWVDIVFVLLVMSPFIIRLSYSRNFSPWVLFDMFWTTWLYVSVYMCVQPFIHSLVLLRDRFLRLNGFLSQGRFTTELETVLRLYADYAACCQSINNCFSIQLLLVSSSIFVSVVSGLYYAHVTILYQQPVVVPIIKLSSSFSFMAIGVTMAMLGQSISDQAMKFNMHLRELMMEKKTRHIANNNKLHLHILSDPTIVFTAYDFFNIDRTFIFSVIAATTTYLVILIQLEENTSPRPTNSVTSPPTTLPHPGVTASA